MQEQRLATCRQTRPDRDNSRTAASRPSATPISPERVHLFVPFSASPGWVRRNVAVGVLDEDLVRSKPVRGTTKWPTTMTGIPAGTAAERSGIGHATLTPLDSRQSPLSSPSSPESGERSPVRPCPRAGRCCCEGRALCNGFVGVLKNTIADVSPLKTRKPIAATITTPATSAPTLTPLFGAQDPRYAPRRGQAVLPHRSRLVLEAVRDDPAAGPVAESAVVTPVGPMSLMGSPGASCSSSPGITIEYLGSWRGEIRDGGIGRGGNGLLDGCRTDSSPGACSRATRATP